MILGDFEYSTELSSGKLVCSKRMKPLVNRDCDVTPYVYGLRQRSSIHIVQLMARPVERKKNDEG